MGFFGGVFFSRKKKGSEKGKGEKKNRDVNGKTGKKMEIRVRDSRRGSIYIYIYKVR